jgi:hypothetical protein
LSNGIAVAGYVVKRYDAVNPFSLQTIGSACTGNVTSTTCAENNVPTGKWVYSVTPVFATNWTGPESPMSNVVMPGIAAKLAFTTNPSGSTASTTVFAIQPVVTIQDAGGTTVSGSTAPVTLSITTSAGANLTCPTNPLAAVAGVATFAGCKIDKAGTYTLTAAAGGLTNAVSANLTITVGSPAKLAFTTSPSGTTASNTVFATQPVVTVQDAGGNTVTSSSTSVTLSITGSPSGANLTCPTNPPAAVAGVVTFAGCKIDKAGTYTLTATASGLTSGTSSSFTITSGCATPGPQATIFSSADSYILQASPSTHNNGTLDFMEVNPAIGAAMRAVIKFNLPNLGAGCTVTVATLQLKIQEGSGPSIDVFLADRFWTEGGVSWSNVGTLLATPVNSASVGGLQTWAVGTLVQAQYTGTNNGFVVRDHLESGGSGPKYYAHEKGASFAPTLIVTLG